MIFFATFMAVFEIHSFFWATNGSTIVTWNFTKFQFRIFVYPLFHRFFSMQIKNIVIFCEHLLSSIDNTALYYFLNLLFFTNFHGASTYKFVFITWDFSKKVLQIILSLPCQSKELLIQYIVLGFWRKPWSMGWNLAVTYGDRYLTKLVSTYDFETLPRWVARSHWWIQQKKGLYEKTEHVGNVFALKEQSFF